VTPAQFLRAALAENARHMRRFDARLARPCVVPALARLALAGLAALPPRVVAPA